MPKEILVIAILIILGFAAIVYLLNKKLSVLSEESKKSETLTKWLQSMQRSVESNNKTLNDALRQTNQNITSTLQGNTKALNDRLDKAAEVIGAVGKEVGQMAEIGRSMKDLQDFLRSPKLRGNIGEHILKDLLSQMMPKQSFHLQYTFRSGETVDAAITTDNGIIPIDSKFPMENFKKMMSRESEKDKEIARKDFARDVKKHIDDISKKYILTEEGTIDYALMYIPSEPVFYEIMSNNPELADYSHQKRVLPVSPSTFYAYLRAILMSFEGKKIAQEAKQILVTLRAIQKDSEKFGTNLNVLNRHVTNAYNLMSSVLTGFATLGQKINSVQGIANGKDDETPKLPLQ